MAPSDSGRPTSGVDFVDAAHNFVRTGLADIFTGSADYSSPEVVRYEQKLTDDAACIRHVLYIHPSGLIELQYVLTQPPETTLPLGLLTGIVARLHALVASDAYPAIYRKRRFEKWRSVDWRIGANGSALLTNSSGTVSWTDLVTPLTLPTSRIVEPRPSCTSEGYAASRLTSVRRNSPVDSLLAPVIEELLLSGGYTSKAEIQQCASAVAALPGRVARDASH